jgi:signal transduction histidine kinase
VIAVSDTGPGFDTADMAELTGRGKGLGNVRDRLRHMFGERCGIAPAAGGVEIRIPHGTAPSVRARREERA